MGCVDSCDATHRSLRLVEPQLLVPVSQSKPFQSGELI